MSEFTVTVTNKIKEQRVKDLLCGAMEGGSNYWYNITEFINPNNVEVQFKHIDLPFIDGCGIMIGDIEDEEADPTLLNREAMEKGLRIMAEKYDWHLHAFLKEEDDAMTGDVFLQCSLFGEIVFG